MSAVITNLLPIIATYGLGVDSTAILLEWLTNPASRDFDLAQLIVIHAVVGNEFEKSQTDVEEHILPLFREHNIRFLQVGRASASLSDGIVVLEDSRQPTKVFRKANFSLSDELMAVGTTPQFGAHGRKCSMKFKGEVLDAAIKQVVDGPFRHVIGYNAEELDRVEGDLSFSSEHRHSEYPLVDWGWGRKACEDFIESKFGVSWLKSCCTFCPFAGGKSAHLDRLLDAHEAALEALLLEHTALALNPRTTLYAGKSLREAMVANGQQRQVDAFDSYLFKLPHAVYQVRRIYKMKGRAHRSVVRMTPEMSLVEAERMLPEVYPGLGVVETRGSKRAYLHQRAEDSYPAVESFLVVCPAHVIDKDGIPNFDEGFEAALETIASGDTRTNAEVKHLRSEVKAVETARKALWRQKRAAKHRKDFVSGGKKPTAKGFFDALVKVLGEVTGFSPGIVVHNKLILDLVLYEMGINPQKSPWILPGMKGLYRTIGFAHRNQRQGYCGKKRIPFTTTLGPGRWGLTEAGVVHARSLAA
jgi:hypothetical protein